MLWIIGLLSLMAIVMVVATVVAIRHKDLLIAVFATAAISLGLSVFYFLLQAPDVALTEAAIGVALTTVIFLITIRNTKRYEKVNKAGHCKE
jgi:uncharacterized MnhB-related membrane protein